MKEQFVPFELSIKLEELGFKENVLATYFKDGYFLHIPYDISLDKLKNVRAPLWQQAFDWFKTDKNLYADIYRTGKLFSANIEDMLMGNSLCEVCKEINYEEARLKCLEKLIELVETKKDSV